jgi:tRNA pseudouridine38-40 synthase
MTVQEMLDKALSTITGEKINSTGAGRTDAGVHALTFCAHFDTAMNDLGPGCGIISNLNGYLPEDISVTGIRKVKPESSARFSAVSRTYKYFISRRKDPFRKDYSWLFTGNVDVDLMNKASNLLTGYSDFTSFSKLHSGSRTNICKVYHASWEESDNQLILTIRADRFLRNMVRAIAGTLIRVGRGKISLDEFEEIILARDRSSAGESVPARGLFLTDIEYPENIFI